MKRILLTILAILICLVAFSGCSDIRYKGPLSCTRYDGEKDGLESMTEIDIPKDVAEKIISIMNGVQWNNETMNTAGYHYQFELRNATIVYHSKAGLLIDITNGRNAPLDFPTRERLNKLIGVTKEPITLIYDSPIYSFVMSASAVPQIEIEDGVIYTITEGTKERLGTVTEININRFNFDSFIKKYEGFDHSKLASELRKDNKTAYEVTPDASANGIELYYIMEQKDGEKLIVYGHYDDGKKENEIRFIYSVAADDTSLTLTIAETLPSCVAFEHREPNEPYCLYAYDADGHLYRVLWTDWDGLNEKDRVVVEYSDIKEIDQTNPSSGWNPKYEITATSVTLEKGKK